MTWVEEPAGFTPDGKLVTCYRIADPEAFWADVRMGGEMFDASPDGKAVAAAQQAWIDSLPDATVTFEGVFDEG